MSRVWFSPDNLVEKWPEVVGEYRGNCLAEGSTLTDGTALNLSEKDQKWLGLKETFTF